MGAFCLLLPPSIVLDSFFALDLFNFILAPFSFTFHPRRALFLGNDETISLALLHCIPDTSLICYWPRDLASWDCDSEGRTGACFAHLRCPQSLSRWSPRQTEGRIWRESLFRSSATNPATFRCQDDIGLIPFNCHGIRSPARQVKQSAPWSFYNEGRVSQLDFAVGLSAASGLDLSLRRSANQQMGFSWSLLVPPSRESWKATPWLLVSKTLDRVAVLLHKPTAWGTPLKCSAAGSYRFLEVDAVFWILSFIGSLKKNWPKIDECTLSTSYRWIELWSASGLGMRAANWCSMGCIEPADILFGPHSI